MYAPEVKRYVGWNKGEEYLKVSLESTVVCRGGDGGQCQRSIGIAFEIENNS